MSASLLKKVLIVALVLPLAGALVGSNPLSMGQDKPAAKKAEKAKGRLPAYFADVVTADQRAKIYEIQAKHQKEIDAVKDQLEALMKKLDAEVEAVLSAEQKTKLDAARAAAAAKRKPAAEGEGAKKPEAK